MANSSFDIKKSEQSHQKNNKNKTTSYKCFCNNIHWVHLKSKVKQKEEIFGIRKTKVASQGVVSNLAKVTYAWARSSLLLICKTSLKIPKR
jgi:hypothetical protein